MLLVAVCIVVTAAYGIRGVRAQLKPLCTVSEIQSAVKSPGVWERSNETSAQRTHASDGQRKQRQRCPFVPGRYLCEDSVHDDKEWLYRTEWLADCHIPEIEEVAASVKPRRILLVGDSHLRQPFIQIACRWHNQGVLGTMDLYKDSTPFVYDSAKQVPPPPCHSYSAADYPKFFVGIKRGRENVARDSYDWLPKKPETFLQQKNISRCGDQFRAQNGAVEAGLTCVTSSNGATEVCYIHVRTWLSSGCHLKGTMQNLEAYTGHSGGKEAHCRDAIMDRVATWATGKSTRTGNEWWGEHPANADFFISSVAKRAPFDTVVFNKYGAPHAQHAALQHTLAARGFTGKVLFVPNFNNGFRKIVDDEKTTLKIKRDVGGRGDATNDVKDPSTTNFTKGDALESHRQGRSWWAGSLALTKLIASREGDSKANLFTVHGKGHQLSHFDPVTSVESPFESSACRERATGIHKFRVPPSFITRPGKCAGESHFCMPGGAVNQITKYILAAAVANV